MRASCEPLHLRRTPGPNAQHESLLTSSISAEVGDCQPVEETELPAVPSSVLCSGHFTMSGRRITVARHNLRHSAELAMITFAIPPLVCATPQSSRRSRSRYLPSSASLRKARDVMFTLESTMGSTTRDLRSAIQPVWFDLPGTSCAKSCSAAKSPGRCSEEGPPNPQRPLTS